MTPDRLVSVDRVGKKFCRGLKRSLWYGLRDLGAELLGRSGGRSELRKDEFWAAKDISFQLSRGETLGLIGHNGAGKTSLLRMLSGLIRPDVGRIEVRGRLQALIALGAGFNPLLTGRENIYVNASILGVRKKEIDRLFDRIVDFAGVEESLDMPVQSYSSGMAVRLGFAIAAHLEPDVLLIDEVLSVGDIAFRTKCQLRIRELQESGVAIILVSHNLHTISHICTRAITLDRGHIIFDGDTEGAIEVYRDSLIARNAKSEDGLRAGTGEIRIHAVEVLDRTGEHPSAVGICDGVTVRVHYVARERVQDPVFNVAFFVMNGPCVSGIRTDVDGHGFGAVEGEGYVDLDIPHLNLLPNAYTVDAMILHSDGYTFYDRLTKATVVKVRGGLSTNGTTYLPHEWSLRRSDRSEMAAPQYK